MIGETVGHYRIVEKLGEGGMGEVYLADDSELKRKVALKFLPGELSTDPEVLARFKREAQTAAGLNHPNIITVYEVGQHEDRPYIAMAYVDGQPLSRLIAEKRLPVDRVVEITEQICDGLEHAHQAGIIHRDIKPDNILIDNHGRVKILDFGLAKLGGVSKVTGVQSTIGTLYYMSPEQVRAEELDLRSDIFSLGAVFYEMLAGRLPFRGDHSAAVIYSITNEDPEPPSRCNPGVPTELDQIVAKALQKNKSHRYRSVTELNEDLLRFKTGLKPTAARPGTNLLKYLVPTSAVFLAVILVLIFHPFKVEIVPDQRAVAAENSLAVMYFENYVDREDPKRLGEIVTNLLITDLSESEYMEVVSGQRLYDILKLQGKEGVKVIDKNTATEVATYAGAKWMLMGAILQEEPNFILTSKLVDVESGIITASQRVTGEPGEKIFALVDRLTAEIKDDLELPAAAKEEEDVPVAQVTTQSQEAYRYYLEGVEYLNQYYGREAKASFEKALEYDSTFAMAYLQQASGLISGKGEAKKMIEKAVKYSDNVSEKERHYIYSAYARLHGDADRAMRELEAIIGQYPNEKDAYRALGDIYRADMEIEKSIENYRKAIEIDPLDKFSYNLLAYQYQTIGDIDNYIWAIYQYITLAPDEANPYDTRGDLYAFSDKIDKAIDSYKKALERKPDFYPSIVKLGHMHLFKGEYDTAEAYYRQLLESEDANYRASAPMHLALIPMYQGKLRDALAALDEGPGIDKAKGDEAWHYLDRLGYKSAVCAWRGDVDRALEEFHKGDELYRRLNPDDAVGRKSMYVHLLAKKNDFSGAERELAELKKAAETTDKPAMWRYWMAKAVVEMEKGQMDEACASLGQINPHIDAFYYRFHLALAYLKAGRLEESINEFERLLRRYSEDRAQSPYYAVIAYYHLATAYDQTGRYDKAAAGYERFLEIWKDADPDIGEVGEARRRLEQLKVGS